MLVDSHVNLHHERFDGELEDVIERAAEAGVGAMLTISDRLENTDAIAAVSAGRANVWRTVGTHPHHADEAGDLTADALCRLAEAPDVVGIGECGLDYHYEYSGRDAQERVFRAHVEASQRTGLPLVIHTRDADEDTASILSEMHAEAPFTPLLHCYTSGQALCDLALSMGGYVSFSGIVTFKNADDVRAVARSVPLGRLLIETDCPYLAPVPHRGRRCEPAHVAHVAAKLAEVRGEDEDALIRATTDNFFRLFARAARP